MKSVKLRLLGCVFTSLLLVPLLACPPPEEEEDAGSSGHDAGVGTDAGGTDTGGTDAGGTDAGGTDAGGTDAGGGDCLPVNEIDSYDITADKTLTRACSPYVLNNSIEVGSSATLTIEPGVELRFPAGEWLRVGNSSEGKLVAQGTSTDPIVFTSTETEPTPGSWIGIVLGASTLSGTILDHVEVLWAGEDYSYYTLGCVSVSSVHAGRVTISNSTFEGCAQSGVAVLEAGFAFAAFDSNTFRSCDLGMWLNATAVGSVNNNHTYDGTDANQIDGDTIVASASWKAQGVPYLVEGSLEVDGAANPVLTIEAGSELRFAQGEWLRVGSGEPGGLVASGTSTDPVVLTSSEPAPTPGSWIGLVLASETLTGTQLEHTAVRYAGEAYSYYTLGCLSVGAVAPGRVSVTNSTFESCLQSGVAATETGFAFSAFSTNTFTSDPAGMWLNATTVGSVDNDHTYTGTPHNLIEGDTVVASATWLAQAVPYLVNDSIEVDSIDNPVLTIAAGAELRFESGQWLRVGSGDAGGLVTAGTAEEPVLLTSREASPTPGSWIGVVLSADVLAATSLDHTIISYAGEAYSYYTLGCLSADFAVPDRVSVTNSSFESCLQSGVGGVDTGLSFIEFSTNTFTDCDAGVWLNTTAIGSVAGGQTYAGTTRNRIDGDTLVDSATWLGQDVPYYVDESINVDGPNNPVLTLAEGVTLRFASGEWLRVGNGEGGGLVVQGTSGAPVVLESSEAVPTAGAWIGLVFSSQTLASTVVDHAVIRHGGEAYSYYTLGAISLDTTGGNVTVQNSTFEMSLQSDVYIDCDSTPTLTGNSYDLGEVYETDC